MKKQFTILFIAVFTLSACGQEYRSFDEMALEMSKGSAPKITSTALNKSNFNNIVYLDAREKAEYDVSHIKGALFVGYNDFDVSKLPNLKAFKTIVVYCSVGYRSEKVAEKLIEQGYAQTKNLYGGIFDWVNKNHPVYDNSGQPTEKIHPYNKLWSKWLEPNRKIDE